MILLDREKDSAVNNTRSGRYNGLKPIEIHGEEERNSKRLWFQVHTCNQQHR